MVVSFLMLYIGGFVALQALLMRLMSWLWDNDWFWLAASAFGVVILMATLN